MHSYVLEEIAISINALQNKSRREKHQLWRGTSVECKKKSRTHALEMLESIELSCEMEVMKSGFPATMLPHEQLWMVFLEAIAVGQGKSKKETIEKRLVEFFKTPCYYCGETVRAKVLPGNWLLCPRCQNVWHKDDQGKGKQ